MTGFSPARAGISERLRALVDRQNLGIMDPTLSPQVSTLISANDRRLLGVSDRMGRVAGRGAVGRYFQSMYLILVMPGIRRPRVSPVRVMSTASPKLVVRT